MKEAARRLALSGFSGCPRESGSRPRCGPEQTADEVLDLLHLAVQPAAGSLALVDSLQEAGPTRIESRSELLERWRDGAARPKRDVRAALQADRPRLVVVIGVGSVAVQQAA
jgi:hypothetical protein